MAGFVDETVFHQLLHWHHFWDGGSSSAALVSDGLFHAGSWICAVAGLFLFADLRRRHAAVIGRWVAGILVGAGRFSSTTFQHKVLDLHQIRYHVVIWAYNLTWNLLVVALLVGGAVLLWRSRRGAGRDGRG